MFSVRNVIFMVKTSEVLRFQMEVRKSPRFCKVQRPISLPLLPFSTGVYHEGILDASTGLVAHLHGQSKLNATTRTTDIVSFADGKPIMAKYLPMQLPDEQVLENINREHGKGNYSLLFNNCQHFTNVCLLGIRQSFQLSQISAVVIILAIVALVVLSMKK